MIADYYVSKYANPDEEANHDTIFQLSLDKDIVKVTKIRHYLIYPIHINLPTFIQLKQTLAGGA